jgi:sigma-54-interacting transcriptional regulator
MAQPFGLAGKVDPSLAHHSLAQPSDDRRGAQSPVSDEGLARFTNLNLLIMGADDVAASFVTSLWSYLSAPRVVRRRGEQLQLLSTSPPADTIVIYDLHTLTRREQDALHRWLNAGNGRTRVVSIATQSLLPVLETGAFNDELYYRLNVLTLDLRSPVAPADSGIRA